MKGIYKYTDLKNGEVVYVGKDSHIDKNQRHYAHVAPSGYNDQQIHRVIQNNPNRYEYSVLYSSDYVSDDDLIMLEMSFIERYDPKFNFTKGGEGLCGYKFTEETKQKIREANKGKKLSKETKQKISKSKKGQEPWNKGKSTPDKTKKKLSEAHKGKILSDKHKESISKSNNTSGYYRVSKHKDKKYKQGFYWRYEYYEHGKYKTISSINIKKLEEKVKSKGLKWLKFEKEE